MRSVRVLFQLGEQSNSLQMLYTNEGEWVHCAFICKYLDQRGYSSDSRDDIQLSPESGFSGMLEMVFTYDACLDFQLLYIQYSSRAFFQVYVAIYRSLFPPMAEDVLG